MKSSRSISSAPHVARSALFRGFLSTGSGGSAGFGAGAVIDSRAGLWRQFRSPDSGASISYPASWVLDRAVHTDMIYPRQSFALHSAATSPTFYGPDPNMAGYGHGDVFLWLLHYDDLQLGPDAPRFAPITSYRALPPMKAGFIEFDRRICGISGSTRTFILRLWVGYRASRSTRVLLDRSLSTLRLP